MYFYAIYDPLGVTRNQGCPRLEVCPRLPVHLLLCVLVCQYLQTHPHTPHTHTYMFMASNVDHVFAIQPRTHKSDFLRLTEDKMANFFV